MKMLIIFVVMIFGAIAAVKTGLSFSDKSTLVSMLANVDRLDNLSKKSESEIKQEIISEAKRNKLDFLDPEDIKISPLTDGIEVSFEYTAKVELMPGLGFDLEMVTEPAKLAD